MTPTVARSFAGILRVVLAAAILLVAPALPAVAASDPGPIAVGPTITALPEGDTADQPSLLQDVFATGIADGSGCREVTSTGDLLSMAQLVQLQQALGTEGDATDALVGALGRYGDAPELAVLTVGRLGNKYVLTGRVLDTRSASVARSAQRTTTSADDIPDLVFQVGRAVAKRVPCSEEWLGTITVKRQANLSWSDQNDYMTSQMTGTFQEQVVYTFLPGSLVKVELTGGVDQTSVEHYFKAGHTDTIKLRMDNRGTSDDSGTLEVGWVNAGTYQLDPGSAHFTSRSQLTVSCSGDCDLKEPIRTSDEVETFSYGPVVTAQAPADATQLRGSQTKPFEFGINNAMYRGTETVTWELHQGE